MTVNANRKWHSIAMKLRPGVAREVEEALRVEEIIQYRLKWRIATAINSVCTVWPITWEFLQ